MNRSGHVLIVEDNPADVELVRASVEDCGLLHHLHFVRDGEEALLFLRREGLHADAPQPRLVILDLNMPRLSGLEVLAALRAERLEVPAVIFTSSGDDGDRRRALALGAAAYLMKPVRFAEFCRVITALLQEHVPPLP
ncbi:response regulator receiver protein [Deinococcus phoenicis]|uniref:Response regulator receiver protein n=1 Tax=Deinococcus phoenicis TaxID=1476583 RepID=A0A016QU43_9DEIO|nr:response regulator [Deinococcus phoenicis]EYB69568.1 response regulator receiver protein [Deinococcus phoenicis]